MAKINFLKQPSPRRDSDWTLVGKVWKHKTKANALSGRFGIKTKDESGQLQDVFTEITIKTGDPIMIRPNQNQREGKKDPQYLMYMLKTAVK